MSARTPSFTIGRALVAVLGVSAALLAAPSGASATFTGSVAGGNGALTGNSGDDTLVIGRSGSVLTHNRFVVGDPGFASATDFDSSVAGIQTVANSAAASLAIAAGGGNDTVEVGSDAVRKSLIVANVTVDGEGNVDQLVVDDSTGGGARTVALSSTEVTGVAGDVDYTTVERLRVEGGGAADNVTVDDPVAFTTLMTGGGNDTVTLQSGSLAGGTLDGGTGLDAFRYPAAGGARTVRLPATERLLQAQLDGAQEVPPRASAATGFGTVRFSPDDNRIDYRILEIGLASFTDSHIHQAAPGVIGPVIFPIGSSSGYTVVPGGLQRTGPDQAFPAASAASLLAGNTYYNIHTTAFPGGEIRGQILLQSDAYGEATGTFGVRSVERAEGGDGADELVGDDTGNRLTGGEGVDTLSGGKGDDLINAFDIDPTAGETVDCGAGANDVAWVDSTDATTDCETVRHAGLAQVIPASGTLAFDPGDGVVNELLLSGPSLAGLFTIRDTGGEPLLPGPGCSRVSDIEVRCQSAGVSRARIEGGDGNDTLSSVSSVATDFLGGDDNDAIMGGGGADVLSGEDGNDSLDGRGGPDEMSGGPGADVVTYASRSGSGVVVSMDGVANDGGVGEGDQVASDSETLTGTPKNDVLAGTAGAQTLSGGDGTDTLDGGLGADTLFGGGGTDTATYASRTQAVNVSLDDVRNDGEAAELDFVRGSDVENLIGGSGGDTLTGNMALNVISSGNGSDTIFARDGTALTDSLNCSGGTDSFQVDPSDVFGPGRSCETQLP